MVTSKKLSLEDLLHILEESRVENCDNQYCEVKAAAGGFPESAVDTICAFANTPGGGMLILGVSETLDFAVVGVYDAKACQQRLASCAKNEFSVPVDLTSGLVTVDDKLVVWTQIGEADTSVKPVKAKRGKRAFIRQFDGDFVLSEQEEQMFVAARGQSRFDEDPVPRTSLDELNWELTDAFIANRKGKSSTLSRMGDEEVLLRCGVMTSSGELTKAGLLCLGIYPQQYLPSYTIRASVQKQSRQTGRVRATNTHSFDGPIPTMLYEAVQWVRENSDELVLDSANGSVRNVGEYPSIVMRELIANSLIHRDIGPMALHQDISLIVEDDRLVISNPGGLYGLHVDELGRTGSKTRNSRMADICQYVLASDGANVIEKLGSGIPRVLDELADLSMPSPRFIDGGIYFTVILDSVLARSPVGETPNSNRVGEDSVLTLLRQGPKSKSQIQRATRLTPTQTRHTIEKLIAEQRIQKIGKDKSPNTTYALLLDE